MADSLTVALHPENETLWLETLIRAIEDVRRVVKDIDLAVTRDRKGRPWVVTRLQSTVPTITLKPAVDGTQVVDAIAEGLRVLAGEEDPREVPRYFSEDALDHLREMRHLFRGKYRARSIVFSTNEQPEIATVGADIDEKVARVLRGSYTMLGSLEGTLEALNMRPKPPAFTIWERMTGRPVRCSFNREQWLDRVVALLKRQSRALVTGEVRFFRNGMPRSIGEIRDIRDMTPDPSLPPGEFGSVPDLTSGKDTVEYLRSMRE
jgi:hypothetical protein